MQTFKEVTSRLREDVRALAQNLRKDQELRNAICVTYSHTALALAGSAVLATGMINGKFELDLSNATLLFIVGSLDYMSLTTNIILTRKTLDKRQ